MRKSIIAISVALLFNATMALAANGGESNNTGCNGVGNANSPCVGGGSGTTQGQGQNQQQQQQQGQIQGQAQGQAQVGINRNTNANTGTNTSTNTNTVTVKPEVNNTVNTNVKVNPDITTTNNVRVDPRINTDVQNNVGNVTAKVGDVSAVTGASTSNAKATATQSQTAQGGAGGAGGAAEVKNAGNNTGTANVVVQGDAAQERNPVSTAVGSTVITGSDQCLVPVSAGGQAVTFGISIGTAVADKICEALKLTRQLEAMGYKAQALKLLKAADQRVADAFAD